MAELAEATETPANNNNPIPKSVLISVLLLGKNLLENWRVNPGRGSGQDRAYSAIPVDEG
jgi:hypothetical protein